MPKFEKKWQQNNKKEKKRPYVFKVLHNMLKPEDREKMMRIVRNIEQAKKEKEMMDNVSV